MDSYKYKVTVGMPVYGVEKYIRKCLASVPSQTSNFEFVTGSMLHNGIIFNT